MSPTRLLPKLLLSAVSLSAAIAATAAMAQGGATVPGATPPDTSAPSPQSRIPAPAATDATNNPQESDAHPGGAPTSTKHTTKHKKKAPATPKPADNDNNATPNNPQ